jgi:hypothetical protein
MNRLLRLREAGQSLWLDFLRRSLIRGGGLERLRREDGVSGVTSNPADGLRWSASGAWTGSEARSVAPSNHWQRGVETVVLTPTQMAAVVGVALAGAAYVPQIWHLVRVHCSAGISRFAFGVWLVASLLVTTHAIAIGAVIFILLGGVQIVATTIILVYATKYAFSYCVSHAPGGFGAKRMGRLRRRTGGARV